MPDGEGGAIGLEDDDAADGMPGDAADGMPGDAADGMPGDAADDMPGRAPGVADGTPGLAEIAEAGDFAAAPPFCESMDLRVLNKPLAAAGLADAEVEEAEDRAEDLDAGIGADGFAPDAADGMDADGAEDIDAD